MFTIKAFRTSSKGIRQQDTWEANSYSVQTIPKEKIEIYFENGENSSQTRIDVCKEGFHKVIIENSNGQTTDVYGIEAI